MIPTLPTPIDKYEKAYMDRLLEAIRRAFQFTVDQNTAITSLLLRSSGGKVYRIEVDDSGNLTTTYVQG